jgi:hypothetical protein
MEKIFAKLITIKEYKAWFFDLKPPRLESAYPFHIDNFSKKLVYKLMDITHKHGFSCSSPIFGDKNHPKEVVFSIGSMLPSTRSLKKYSSKMYECLSDITKFNNELNKQVDFSVIDLSMFTDIDLEYFDPLILATIKDEKYMGSWDLYYEDMIKINPQTAELIYRCVDFEKTNNKDITLVSNQLDQSLLIVEEILSKK